MEKLNPKDRRFFERFSARFPAKIKDTNNVFGDMIFLKNASASGIKVASKQKMYVNDKVALEVELQNRSYPMTLKGKVMWVKDSLDNNWEIGLKFLKMDFMQTARLYEQVSTNFSM